MPTSGSPVSAAHSHQGVDVLVVPHVLVAIGHHRPATVPPSLPDDVHLGRQEGVRRPHDAADVEVVLPVLDRNMEAMAMGVEVSDDRVPPPVAIAVDDVAPIAGSQKLGVQPGVVGPRLRMRPYTDDVHVSGA